MSAYEQKCLCRSRAISLNKDLFSAQAESASCRLQAMVLRRHLRAASRMSVEEREELSIEVLGWMREAERFQRRALRLEAQLLDLPTVAKCFICGGTGVVVGNGSSIGGYQ